MSEAVMLFNFVFSWYFLFIVAMTIMMIYFIYGGWTMKRGTRQNAFLRRIYPWMFKHIYIISFRDLAGRPVLEGCKARVIYHSDGSNTMELVNGQNQPVPDQKYFWPSGKGFILFARWINAQTLCPLDTTGIAEMKAKIKESSKGKEEIMIPMDVELGPVTFPTDDPKMLSWVKTSVMRGITTGAYGFSGSGWKQMTPIIILVLLIVGGMVILFTAGQSSAAAAQWNAQAASDSARATDNAVTVMSQLMNITQSQPQEYQYNY